jgi:catecholate siderophore receptor
MAARFDESAIDVNMNQRQTRTNTFISPQDAVIFKPLENMSIYSAYMVSYLLFRHPVTSLER